jgi:hypothetical protein
MTFTTGEPGITPAVLAEQRLRDLARAALAEREEKARRMREQAIEYEKRRLRSTLRSYIDEKIADAAEYVATGLDDPLVEACVGSIRFCLTFDGSELSVNTGTGYRRCRDLAHLGQMLAE